MKCRHEPGRNKIETSENREEANRLFWRVSGQFRHLWDYLKQINVSLKERDGVMEFFTIEKGVTIADMYRPARQ